MKTPIFTLAIGLTLILFMSMTKADKPQKFVQFYIQNLESSEKATELNDFLKTKDGVKMSRTDALNHTIYMILVPGVEYTEKEITQWMKEKGYSISCFHSGEVGKDSFIKLNAGDCESPIKK